MVFCCDLFMTVCALAKFPQEAGLDTHNSLVHLNWRELTASVIAKLSAEDMSAMAILVPRIESVGGTVRALKKAFGLFPKNLWERVRLCGNDVEFNA
jgi:hypothetical protein